MMIAAMVRDRRGVNGCEVVFGLSGTVASRTPITVPYLVDEKGEVVAPKQLMRTETGLVEFHNLLEASTIYGICSFHDYCS